MATKLYAKPIWDIAIITIAMKEAFLKLSPFTQIRNPVIFVVYVVSLLVSGLFMRALLITGGMPAPFLSSVTICLWVTILCANFSEALAESRGKAQANSLRKSRRDIQAKKLSHASRDAKFSCVPAIQLQIGDIVLVEAGEFIPSDGNVIVGIASVNESAITGESAPVIRESGGEHCAVTGGTQVISDWLIIKVTANAGETFLDHMIELVEGKKRHKTPNESALSVLLAGLTFVFLLVCVTLFAFSMHSVAVAGSGDVVTISVLASLFVCLAPTTVGALLSAVSIAGMDRLIQANVVALSGRAIESAGDVNILLLDKTGTVTLGNRQATELIPAEGVSIEALADAAQLASLADETPEGRSIVILAKEKYHLRGRDLRDLGATFIPFTAQTRMSGANLQGRRIRKGSVQAVEAYVQQLGGSISAAVQKSVETISRQGGTALVVAEGEKILGVVALKDIIKGGIRERFAQLRQMGIKTIMVTGDNPLTAAAVAAEAGVDDFLANATPEDKLALIRRLQAQGHLVAMAGDGTNDAPALAQADVALAMNTGTQAAKEAGNLVDLDSNPTKLIEIVEISKQILMTRGALTTFSIANDIAKYFAILPAIFVTTYPALVILNVMHLSTRESAILSAVIFNALDIIFLLPLVLHGITYRRVSVSSSLRTNIFIYGLGGFIAPFFGIKIIDLIIHAIGLV